MTATTETEHVTETWTCAGKRRGRDNKPYFEWVDAKGADRQFDKLKGIAGRRYEVQVAYKEEDRCSVLLNVKFVDALEADDPKRIRWEAIERSDMAAIELARIEAKDAKESALTDLVAPLQELYRKQVGPSRRAAFLAVVTEMVTR